LVIADLHPGRMANGYALARRRVFRQLIEALMFEDVIRPEEAAGTGEWVHYRLHGAGLTGEPVAYRFQGRPRFTFGIVRLKEGEPVMRSCSTGETEAVSLTLMVQEVLENAQSGAAAALSPQAARFANELEETLKKDALACCWRLEAVAAAAPELFGRSYEELESLFADGHPYHPCYKSRIGFTLNDHLAYGPEFDPAIPVMWIAAKADDVLCSTNGTEWRDVLTEQLGGPALERFDEMLLKLGLQPEEYRYLPVHPWQWSKHLAQLAERLGALTGNRRLVLLGNGPQRYRPQQSIRTLANRSQRGKSDLKLSLHITNTSALRDLPIHSVAAAPAVSRWLQALIDSDPYLKEEARVILLHEYAGAAYVPAGGAAGCIWRESVRKYMEDGEEAVPFHALLACSTDGVPYIAPWLATHGAEHWMRCFIRQGCLPVIHLLAAHGIALESHAQNMVLLHRDGLPARVALKDFHEGVEYVERFLAAPYLVPDFGRIHSAYAAGRLGDHFAMEHLTSLKEMLVDALLFMNAGYLAMLAEDKLGFPEERFWQLFIEELERHRAAFPQLRDRFEELDLYAPLCSIERLASKRLFDPAAAQASSGGERPRMSPNPLYKAWRSSHGRDIDKNGGPS
jgi:3,4-dihydroxybenzoyl-citryl-spermidine/N-citryl-spermidine--spermidine ligase